MQTFDAVEGSNEVVELLTAEVSGLTTFQIYLAYHTMAFEATSHQVAVQHNRHSFKKSIDACKRSNDGMYSENVISYNYRNKYKSIGMGINQIEDC
jgi:hypothetical protein